MTHRLPLSHNRSVDSKDKLDDKLEIQERRDAKGRRELHAIVDGEDVGFVTAPLKGDRVEDLYVKPEYRRRGVASALWNEQWQRDWGLTHSPRRTLEGDAWAAHIAREYQESLPPLAGDHVEHSPPTGKLTYRHAMLGDRLTDYRGNPTGLEGTDDGQALIADVDGKTVGNIIWEEYDDCVFVLHLWVDPEHRGKGIGSELARQLKELYPQLPLDQEVGGNPRVREMFASLNSRPPLHSLDQTPEQTAMDDRVERLRKFLISKWGSRSEGLGRSHPEDLTGACIFATSLAKKVLGEGTVRGNWHHTYLQLDDGTIVDLTGAAGVREQALERQKLHEQYPHTKSPFFVGPDVDPHMHDPAFLKTRDFRDTWNSVQDTTQEWADEFLQIEHHIDAGRGL
jgi:GNAT superfamily N-acetyltransferase